MDGGQSAGLSGAGEPALVRLGALLLLAVPVSAMLALWSGFYGLDDAYITLHNARVLQSGAPDPVYGVSPLVGATSAVHLLLVTLAGLVVPLLLAPLLVAVLSLLLYAWALTGLIERVGIRGWRALLLLGTGLLWGNSLIWYLNGLETVLAMAVVALALRLADDRRWLPWLAGLMPFVRPELAILGGLLTLRLAWSLRAEPLALAQAAAKVVAAAAPFALWYLAETGAPLPLTGSAKVVFFGGVDFSPGDRLTILGSALQVTGLLLLLPGVAGLRRLPGGWCSGLFILFFLLLGLLTLPFSLHWNHGRYQAVFVPVLIAGLAALAALRWRATDLLLVLLAAFAGAGLVRSAAFLSTDHFRPWREMGEMIVRLPPTATIMVHDAGYAAWVRPQGKLVDAVGLKTPQAMESHRRHGSTPSDMAAAMKEISALGPITHVVALTDDIWGEMTSELTRSGWQLRPIAEGGNKGFRVQEARPPER